MIRIWLANFAVALVLFGAAFPVRTCEAERPVKLRFEWNDGPSMLVGRELLQLGPESVPSAIGAEPLHAKTLFLAIPKGSDSEIVSVDVSRPKELKSLGVISGPFRAPVTFVSPPPMVGSDMMIFFGEGARWLRFDAERGWFLAEEISIPEGPIVSMFHAVGSEPRGPYLALTASDDLVNYIVEDRRLKVLSKLELQNGLVPVRADFDGDGQADLTIVARTFAQVTVMGHLSSGRTPTFSAGTDGPYGQNIRRVIAGEMNGVLGMDMLVETMPQRTMWLCSGGDLPLCTPQKLSPFPSDVTAVADLDHDGIDEFLYLEGNRIYAATVPPGDPVVSGTISTDTGIPLGSIAPDGTATIDADATKAKILIRIKIGNRLTTHRQMVTLGDESRIALLRTGQYPSLPLADQPTCIGYLGRTRSGTWGRTFNRCPRNYAIMELDDATLKSISCCPLPRSIQLTNETAIAETMCPAGMIATGVTVVADERRASSLICRGIRTPNVIVGPHEPGVYWGSGLSMRGESTAIARSEIPLAIREGTGRLSRDRWDVDGCTYRPQPRNDRGRVLVGRIPGACSSAIFAPLLQTGEKTEEIPLFAPCSVAPDPLNPLAGCKNPLPLGTAKK